MGDDPESALVLELRGLAKSSGDEFSLARGGYDVRLVYVSGSSASLTLRHGYDAAAKRSGTEARAAGYRESAQREALQGVRPMLVQLRPETELERMGKAEGVSREHQTGDADFDHAVYVDSPTTDEALLHAVLGPDVRAAVLELFALGLRKITIDDEDRRVEAHISTFADGKEHDARGEQMVTAFARLLGALPAVRDSGGAHPTDPFRLPLRVASFFAVAGFIGAIPSYFAIADHFACTEGTSDGEGTNLKDGCVAPGLLALVLAVVAGAAVAVVTRRLLLPGLSGRSNSASQLTLATFAAYFLAAELVFVVASYLGLARH